MILRKKPWFSIIKTWDDVYENIELSKKWALNIPWTEEKHLKSWAMKINWNKIYYYWIKKGYLKYAVIQEILCPDMINWFWLDSIKEEIQNIPENIKEDYIKWRISFFENMKDYWDNLSDDNLKKFKMKKKEEYSYSENIWKITEYLNRIFK